MNRTILTRQLSLSYRSQNVHLQKEIQKLFSSYTTYHNFEVKYFQCLVIARHHTFRCGRTFNQELDGGLFSEIIDINNEQCEFMISNKKYQFKGKVRF